MKKYIIANWKENKTVEEALNWLIDFKTARSGNEESLNPIVCASFPLLYPLSEKLKQLNLNVDLGAQNISRFEKGAHTGEVGAFQIRSVAKYVLLGHSERRRDFNETAETLLTKIDQCLANGLCPVVCIGSGSELQELSERFTGKEIIVYEPPEAISTDGLFHPIDLNSIRKITAGFRALLKAETPVLYGGSVNPDNALKILSCPEIDGVLVGAASLNVKDFILIIEEGER